MMINCIEFNLTRNQVCLSYKQRVCKSEFSQDLSSFPKIKDLFIKFKLAHCVTVAIMPIRPVKQFRTTCTCTAVYVTIYMWRTRYSKKFSWKCTLEPLCQQSRSRFEQLPEDDICKTVHTPPRFMEMDFNLETCVH